MNIVAILAGGLHNRLNTPSEKQFDIINGRVVIEYAISAALCSEADEVIVVINNEYINFIRNKYGVIAIDSGIDRNKSIHNVLEYIDKNYTCYTCDKLVLLEGVCPMVTSDLLNRYFDYLNDYDAVFTVDKINTNLARYDRQIVNRDEYFLVESPDAYRYDIIKDNFNVNSQYSTILNMLPQNTKIKFYDEFINYMKIITKKDLLVAETLIKNEHTSDEFDIYNNDYILNLLSKFRNMNWQGTKQWERRLKNDILYLFNKYSIVSHKVNIDAYMGLVFMSKSNEFMLY